MTNVQVKMTLHPSFVPHLRTLSEPPWEVTETGWGEFEIGITARLSFARPGAGLTRDDRSSSWLQRRRRLSSSCTS